MNRPTLVPQYQKMRVGKVAAALAIPLLNNPVDGVSGSTDMLASHQASTMLEKAKTNVGFGENTPSRTEAWVFDLRHSTLTAEDINSILQTKEFRKIQLAFYKIDLIFTLLSANTEETMTLIRKHTESPVTPLCHTQDPKPTLKALKLLDEAKHTFKAFTFSLTLEFELCIQPRSTMRHHHRMSLMDLKDRFKMILRTLHEFQNQFPKVWDSSCHKSVNLNLSLSQLWADVATIEKLLLQVPTVALEAIRLHGGLPGDTLHDYFVSWLHLADETKRKPQKLLS